MDVNYIATIAIVVVGIGAALLLFVSTLRAVSRFRVDDYREEVKALRAELATLTNSNEQLYEYVESTVKKWQARMRRKEGKDEGDNQVDLSKFWPNGPPQPGEKPAETPATPADPGSLSYNEQLALATRGLGHKKR